MSKQKDEDIGNNILTICMLPAFILSRGFWLMKTWEWSLDKYYQLTTPGYWLCCFFGMCMGFVIHMNILARREDLEHSNDRGERMLSHVITGWVVMFILWLGHLIFC